MLRCRQFLLIGDRRLEHGTLTLPGRLVDQLGGDTRLDGGQRLFPVALRRAMFEHGLGGPWHRRDAMRRPGKVTGSLLVALAAGLGVQAAQAEHARILATGKRLEG